MRRLYLAGPMSGYPEHNIPAFREAATRLRCLGFEVVSPAEGEGAEQDGRSWEDWMRRDIKLLADCEAVACLPGWEQSRGATLETNIARDLGMPLLCAVTLEEIEQGRRGCGLGRESLDATLAEVVAWQAETFPVATSRSRVEHLRREVLELVEDPSDPEEMADVLMLLAGLAAGEGVDLHAALRTKLEKNRARQWGEPDEHGVVEHVRETAAP